MLLYVCSWDSRQCTIREPFLQVCLMERLHSMHCTHRLLCVPFPSFALQVAITIYWLGRTIHSSKDYHGPQLDLSAFGSVVSPAQVRHPPLKCAVGAVRSCIRWCGVNLPDGGVVEQFGLALCSKE